MAVLFRMLYATGMRLEEALTLRDIDVDVVAKTLFIKGAKNGQDRRIPMSASLAQVCEEYRAYRNVHSL
jgi:integrase